MSAGGWDYSALLQDERWLQRRRQVLKRDGGACVQCGARQRLTIHHKKYTGRPWEAPLEDLETLCRRCHAAKERGPIADFHAGEDDLEEQGLAYRKRFSAPWPCPHCGAVEVQEERPRINGKWSVRCFACNMYGHETARLGVAWRNFLVTPIPCCDIE